MGQRSFLTRLRAWLVRTGGQCTCWSYSGPEHGGLVPTHRCSRGCELHGPCRRCGA